MRNTAKSWHIFHNDLRDIEGVMHLCDQADHSVASIDPDAALAIEADKAVTLKVLKRISANQYALTDIHASAKPAEHKTNVR